MKKKVVSFLLCAAMTTGLLAGCGAADDGASASVGAEPAESTAAEGNGDLPILGAGIYSSTDNFNSYIGKAIANAAKGVFQVNVDDGQLDQSTQLNQIDTAIAKGAKAITVSVVDITAAPTIIQKCEEAGNIPLIFFNKEITDKEVVDSYDNLYQVTSTGGDYGANIQGEEVAEWWRAHPEMDKNKDGKLQLINIMGDPSHTATQPRAKAVKDTIEKAGIELDVLEEDTGKWDTATAKEKMDAWISKYGDEVECITAANDAMALGALQSVEAAGYNEKGEESDKYVPIFGIDALPETLTKIESGEIAGSVLQDAKTQGETIVKIADNLINGKEALGGTDLEFDTDGSKAVRIPYQAISKDTLQIAEDSYK